MGGLGTNVGSVAWHLMVKVSSAVGGRIKAFRLEQFALGAATKALDRWGRGTMDCFFPEPLTPTQLCNGTCFLFTRTDRFLDCCTGSMLVG